MKVAHAWRVKIRFGPLGVLESRTATAWSRWATSTHWPSPLLWLLLRHWSRWATSTHWPSPLLWLLLRHWSRWATSTHWPSALLWLLLRHSASERSSSFIPLLLPHVPAATNDLESSGLAATARRCSKTSLYRRTSASASRKRSPAMLST